MEELFELRRSIEERRYVDALLIVDELEEMSRDDKINRMDSYAQVLLLHLIKQDAERRSTRSWELSIRNALRQIARTNQRRKSGGAYLSNTELVIIIHEAYDAALAAAALEAFEGRYEADELAEMVDQATIEQRALALILEQPQ